MNRDTPELQASLILASQAIEEHDFAKAEEILTALNKRFPDEPDCLAALTLLHFSKNDFEKAKQQGLHTLEKMGYNKTILVCLVIIAQKEENFSDVENYLHQITAHEPNNPDVYRDLSVFYRQQKQYDQAVEQIKKAIVLNPHNIEYYNQLGILYGRLGQTDQAEKTFHHALAFDPENIPVLNSLEALYQKNAHFEKAKVICEKALVLAEKHQDVDNQPFVQFNLSLLQLLLGEYTEGWKNYQARKRLIKNNYLMKEVPVWDGSTSLQQKNIYVVFEQGFGDYLMLIRFCEPLQKQGAYVIALCPKELAEIIASVPFVQEVQHSLSIIPKPQSCQVLIGDLPGIFHCQVASIPNTLPYLFANRDKTKQTQGIFTSKKIKVGLAWSGSKQHAYQEERSIALAELAPIFTCKEIQAYSLMLDDPHQQLDAFHQDIIDLKAYIHDFSDTAALIMHLDLIITVDTSLVHLAGAMGKPCWVLLRNPPDWRWLLAREDSPWYPSVKLFRQTQTGNWDSVVRSVLAALQNVLAN